MARPRWLSCWPPPIGGWNVAAIATLFRRIQFRLWDPPACPMQAQGAVSRLWRGRFKMRRREFITLVGGAMAWPLAAQAQQRAFPVIVLLSSRSPDIDTPLISVIRQALNEKGLVEGQNVALDYRWAEGQYDRLAGLAADLVRREVAVIITIGRWAS